ncbi:MAG TPA: hypothetical protein DCS19_06135 [Flavobacterium sp.]|nr:hypothetical protein [Flavobacterium sp.]
MKRSILILVSILILTLSVLTFIRFSNDHIECGTIVKKEVDKNGNKINKEEHICKEKYNF